MNGRTWTLLLAAAVLSGCRSAQFNLFCGHPGEHEFARVELPDVVPARRISILSTFSPGTMLSYSCIDESYVMQGDPVRVCGRDGRWTNERAWCDKNVAFGKKVVENGPNNGESEDALTDGLTSPEDSYCLSVPGAVDDETSFFEVQLDGDYAINSVNVFFGGVADPSWLGDEVVSLTDGSSDPLRCRKTAARLGASLNETYQCLAFSDVFTPSSTGPQKRRKQRLTAARAVRFENTKPFAIPVCEVTAFANLAKLECGRPETPANGRAVITSLANAKLAEYSCDPDYQLQGPQNRTCTGRRWSGDQPVCVYAPVESTTPEETTVPTTVKPESGGLTVGAIIGIVSGVVLLIALIVVLFILYRYGRLTCCRSKPKPPASKPPKMTTIPTVPLATDAHYVPVLSDEPQAAAGRPESDYSNKEEVNYAKLSDFQPVAPTEQPVYANLEDGQPIYAKVIRAKASNEDLAALPPKLLDETSGSPFQNKNRKSYIPKMYQTETPQNQSLGALNAQLKDVVKGKQREMLNTNV